MPLALRKAKAVAAGSKMFMFLGAGLAPFLSEDGSHVFTCGILMNSNTRDLTNVGDVS